MAQDMRYNGGYKSYNGSLSPRRVAPPGVSHSPNRSAPPYVDHEEGQGYDNEHIEYNYNSINNHATQPPHATKGGPTAGSADNHNLYLTCIDSLRMQFEELGHKIADLREDRKVDKNQAETLRKLSHQSMKRHIQDLNDKIAKIEEKHKQSQQQIQILKHRMNVVIHAENNKLQPSFKTWMQETCKLPQYLPLFLKHGYNELNVVRLMTESDLIDIGINQMEDRMHINTQIQHMNNDPNYALNEYHCNYDTAANKESHKHIEGSAHAHEMKEEIPRISWNQIPDVLRKGCNDVNIYRYNELQVKVMDDLYTNACNMIVSPAASGKTVAVLLSLIYKLEKQEGSAHCLLIAVDEIHVLVIKELCDKLTKYMDDFQVIEQIKGCPPHILFSSLESGKNIIICSLSKALSLFAKSGENLNEHLLGITVFDGDTLCVAPLFKRKTQKVFEYISAAHATANIDVTVISNSCCVEMQSNVNILFGNKASSAISIHKYTNYDNLRFWNTYCDEKDRIGCLLDVCKYNPFDRGVVYCSGRGEAKKVNKHMCERKYRCRILENNKTVEDGLEIIRMFNADEIDYIILYTYSPICLLHNIDVNKLKIIIHYTIMEALADYLKRCCICKYGGSTNKIHCISFDSWQDIERKCNIKIEELPDDMELLREDDGYDDNYQYKEEALKHTELKSRAVKQNNYNHHNNNNNNNASGLEYQLMQSIDEYLVHSNMESVLQLNNVSVYIWGTVMDKKLRKLDTLQMEDFIDLIVDLFRDKEYSSMCENRFYAMFTTLVQFLDTYEKQHPIYLKHLAHLIAHLCLHVCVRAQKIFQFFIDQYRKSSQEANHIQVRTVNKFISYSKKELAKNQASAKMLLDVNNFTIK